jgi:hypothetical protein
MAYLANCSLYETTSFKNCEFFRSLAISPNLSMNFRSADIFERPALFKPCSSLNGPTHALISCLRRVTVVGYSLKI